MDSVGSIGDLVRFDRDEELITQGQRDYPFYVIKSGEVRVVEKCGTHEQPIATHSVSSFTGDVDMLTGRAAVISVIANGEVEAYKLCAWRLRQLLGKCPQVSEMLLDAFQLRRKLLEESDFVGVRLIGDTGSRETSRMREFFYKNHVPHTFYEASSPDSQALLECIDAKDLETPIVHCNGHTVGNPSLSQTGGMHRHLAQR